MSEKKKERGEPTTQLKNKKRPKSSKAPISMKKKGGGVGKQKEPARKKGTL